MRGAINIILIGAGGEVTAIVLSRVNDVLEFCVLSATLIGLIWKIFKKEKHDSNRPQPKK